MKLKIYLEYCPIKLTHLYDLNQGQVVYFLKESMIGFERLFNKFGSFKVNSSMIYLNEKGMCKVWIHENPALLSIPSIKMK